MSAHPFGRPAGVPVDHPGRRILADATAAIIIVAVALFVVLP